MMSYSVAHAGMGVAPAMGPPLEPKQQICFDFTKGSCLRGAGCKYSHDPEVIASVNSHERGICFDWLRGSCTRGVICRFSHDVTNLIQQQQAQQLQQQHSLSLGGRRSTAICYDYVKGLCTRHDCRYMHDLTTIIKGLHPASSPAVEMCFDFSRGKCLRGAVCKYAHDPRLVLCSPLMAIYPQAYVGAAGVGNPPGVPLLPSYLPNQSPMHIAHFAALQQEQRMYAAHSLGLAGPLSAGMGERYTAAHGSAQQQEQFLAARQQRSVCAYPADGHLGQAPVWLPVAHGMRHDGPPFLPQPLPPPSRMLDNHLKATAWGSKVATQALTSRLVTVYSSPACLQVSMPLEMTADFKSAPDGGGEDAKCVAFEENAMPLSLPESQQQCGREQGEQAASLGLRAVTIALKSQLHVHARKPGSIGADWSARRSDLPPPPQQQAPACEASTPRASATTPFYLTPPADCSLHAAAGALLQSKGTGSGGSSLDPVCPPPRSHQLVQQPQLSENLAPRAGAPSSGTLAFVQRTQSQADGDLELMQHFTSIWAMPPRT